MPEILHHALQVLRLVPSPHVRECPRSRALQPRRPRRRAWRSPTPSSRFRSRPSGAGAAEAAEEKDEFDVELAEVGPNKVKVIKVVREVTGLGLKEAKEMVDGAPKVVKEGASKAEAEDIKTKLEAEGAKVNLK